MTQHVAIVAHHSDWRYHQHPEDHPVRPQPLSGADLSDGTRAQFYARLDALQRAGVNAERALQQAYLAFPMMRVLESQDAQKRANVLEKTEQAEITKLARALGCTVRSTSQSRASKVAPGIPDLIVSHRARGFFGWWETKRALGGRLSTAQQEFGQDCLAARIPHGVGDRLAFAAWLNTHGFTIPETR